MTDVLDNPTLAEQMALKLEEEVIRLNREIVLLVKQKEAIAKRNALLVEENASLGLQLSAQELAHKREQFDLAERVKLAVAQTGEAHRRTGELETNLNDLRNWIAGNCVQRDQEYENLRANVSYLMGQA